MSNVNEKVEFIPLGRKLKTLTLNARTNIEITDFTNKLEEAANNGENSLMFDDLRDVIPTMIMNGTLNEWLRKNELGITGEVDQTTGAYKYTIMW